MRINLSRYYLALLLSLYIPMIFADGVPEALRQWSKAATTDNSTSNASFALGTTLSGSDIQGQIFHQGQSVDLDGYIRPAAPDIGKPAKLYAVVHLHQTGLDSWFMLNANRQWVKWNPADLPESFQALATLNELEAVSLIKGLSGLAGKFEVYLAYSTSSTLQFNAKAYQFDIATNSASMHDLVPKLTSHDLKFNGLGVGVDHIHKTIYVPLSAGFDTASDFNTLINFALGAYGYSFTLNKIQLNNENYINLKNIKYGTSASLQRYLYGNLVDSYQVFFTNLPVIQLEAAKIINDFKSPGTFRLISGKFKQDTGTLNMGIELRGGTSQLYPKKSYGFEISHAENWTKAQDIKLLDLRKDSDWILDAAYADQLLGRNLFGHNLFRQLRSGAYLDQNGQTKGQASIRGTPVEVIQNGEWYGIYLLQEKPDRKLYDLKKINIPKDANGKEQWSLVDFNNPDNGSVLYKAQDHLGTLKIFYNATIIAQSFDQEYPKIKEAIRYEPLLDLTNFVINTNDQEFAAGIANRLDLDSVVDWLIVLDTTGTTDNMDHNFMLGRNAGGKFFFSTWDHDASLAMDYKGIYAHWTPTTSLLVDSYKRNNLIRRLIEIPGTGFNTKLKARWNAIKAQGLNTNTLLAPLVSYLEELQKTNAHQRNKQRWPDAGAAGANDMQMQSLTPAMRMLDARLPLVDRVISNLPE